MSFPPDLPILVVALSLIPCSLAATETPADGAESSSAKTAGDPQVSLKILGIRLKALTSAELVVEADGWLDLLRRKVTAIGEVEIAVEITNQQIETAKKTA